ncbi:MAG: competence/damage-inducible protein A [Eubacteriaceae bacterium]
MICELISVGTELLVGDTLNTNTQYLSRELSLLGISVCYQTTVGDNPKRLKDIFTVALQRSDLIITTGGLGPTQDDLTKEIISEVLGKPLIENKKLEEELLEYFKNREFKMTSNNLKQTLVPEGAEILHNSCGTAPGILFNEKGKTIILMPGPPREMQEMFEKEAVGIINKLQDQLVISRYYNLSDIGESAVEDAILDLIDNQKNPTIATYAKMGEVLIRTTGNGRDENEINQKLDETEKVITERFKENIFSYSKDPLHVAVGRLLKKEKTTLATAESCTGGLVASLLTEQPGISEIYGFGLVTYSNAAKEKLLNVKKSTLLKYGAVSEETAKEMCENLFSISKADICVSVTGIAGPGGETEEKPIGLVYIGVCSFGKCEIIKCHFKGERKIVQIKTANKVFHLIRERIIDKTRK